MKRIRKPKQFELLDQEAHYLECGDGGNAELIYLKPDDETYFYIEGLPHLRQLRKWLDKSIAYLEQQKRETKNG